MNRELATGRASNMQRPTERGASQYANDNTRFETNGLQPFDGRRFELDGRDADIDTNAGLFEETENHFQ